MLITMDLSDPPYAGMAFPQKGMFMNKTKLIRAFFTLTAIIVLAVLLNRLFMRNSMSLSEYVQQNAPSGVPSPLPGETDANEDEEIPSSPEISPSVVAPPPESGDNVPQLTGAALNGDSQLEQRYTLCENFYFEPLSDNLCRYITGVSYPASRQENQGGDPKQKTGPDQGAGANQKTGASQETGPNQGADTNQEAGSDQEAGSSQKTSPDQEAGSSQETGSDQETGSSQKTGSDQVTGANQETDPDQKTGAAPGQPVVTFEDLRYVHILHYDFDGNVAEGELICNAAIARDLVEIFYELYRSEYQLERVRLIDEYDGDAIASMEDNNTSCFNYRVVEGTSSLSKHAYGLAIDINPFYNPYVTYNGDGSEKVSPAAAAFYADRSASFAYKIDEEDLCYKLFLDHGFIWGGNWNSSKDYQHFQKSLD